MPAGQAIDWTNKEVGGVKFLYKGNERNSSGCKLWHGEFIECGHETLRLSISIGQALRTGHQFRCEECRQALIQIDAFVA